MPSKKKIKKMDRTACGYIGDETMKVLDKLSTQLGISIKREGSGSYDDDSFTFKIRATVPDSTGIIVSKEAKDFKAQAKFYGLKAEHLGCIFICNGERVEITGLKPKSRKYPILGKKMNGKSFKFGEETVQRGLVKNGVEV